MQLIQVDVVGAEAAQRRVDRVQQVLARRALVPVRRPDLVDRLGRDDEVVAPALQPAADDFLGATGDVHAAAERIDVGGIDEGDAGVGRLVEDAARRVLFGLQAEGHRAETQT